MSDTKAKFLTILVLVLAAAYVAWPSQNKPGFRPGSSLEGTKLNLGLDLQGGAWFRVRLKPEGLTAEELRTGTDEAMSILSHRVNLRGLKEPRITKVGGNEIQIEVPGLKSSQEVDQFKKVILSAGRLEFHIEASEADQAEYARTQVAPPGTRWYEPRGTRGAGGGGLLCKTDVAMDGRDIDSASSSRDEGGRPAVSFNMTPDGANKFAQVTERNLHKQLAIILDDVLVSAPEIQSRISDHGQITGRFTLQEVQDMVTVLSTGALRAPLEMVGSSFLGPSLGQDAIDRGLKSCYFAVVIVMLFMLVYYRHAGMVANIAMIMNVTLLLALLAVLGATLTLPGIAGIVLTMGMAVDANILVFERIREEKSAGKNAQQCFNAGYERAFSAIIDGNLTTLLTGIVLYVFGTGPIQGFAATLSLGILTTLFTALTCSRIMMKLMMETGMVKEWSMMSAMSKPNIPFMKLAPKAVAVSVVLILAGVGVWFARGDDKYGIDFRGGVALQMRFRKPTSIDDVRAGVAAIAGPTGPKYAGAEVQSVLLGSDSGTTGAREAMQFQIRTLAVGGSEVDPEKFKGELEADLRKQFAGKIPEPAVQLGNEKIDAPNPYAGGGTIRISLAEERPAKELIEKIQKALAGLGLGKPADAPAHYVVALGTDGKVVRDGPATMFEVWLMPPDFVDWNRRAEQISGELKRMGYPLSGDPFPSIETVSASIVGELKEKAYIALVISWIGIILYLAVRFELKYGLAAVAALVHDSVIAVTWTVILDAVIPKSWGIDLAVSLTTVAAALTIIGYSVNDTVVIFDRLRENFREMKSKGLAQLIDDSLNQTLSRTIITATTVFFTVTVLLVVTLTSGGGIAALSMPMLIGVMVGTYSSLFIAAPLIYWWRGAKPAEAKA